METKTIKEQLRQFTYYIIIAAISLLTIVVFPLIGSGSSITIEECFPTTQVGWIIYIIERVLVIVMNLTIFTSFIQQAKVNIKDNPNYLKANEILQRHHPKEYRPRSESRYLGQTYTTKGISLALTTVASLFVIGSAILNYDYMILIATTFSVITTIVMGVIQMRKTELYYTTEYYDYANYIEKSQTRLNEEQENRTEEQGNIDIHEVDIKVDQTLQ